MRKANDVERVVMADGWHCDTKCPQLIIEDARSLSAKCALSGKDLDWYDSFVAGCVDQEA
tara:strand:- start:6241 stop:6420 length:180 start_codon:yes stop_codon:yes gene_type:complete